jgi:hypothetical protein
MYMQHMHQQALAQQFAAAQQSPHFPIGVHPQYPPFAAPQQPHGLQNPHQNHQKADRRSGGHTRAHTPAPASPLTPQQANPFIHKPTTPTPTVTIPSMFSPAASDPLYSMISAEQKLRERERHLYERSRQESSFNHAAAQKMAPSQPPSFSNSIFNKPDLVSYLDYLEANWPRQSVCKKTSWPTVFLARNLDRFLSTGFIRAIFQTGR